MARQVEHLKLARSKIKQMAVIHPQHLACQGGERPALKASPYMALHHNLWPSNSLAWDLPFDMIK